MSQIGIRELVKHESIIILMKKNEQKQNIQSTICEFISARKKFGTNYFGYCALVQQQKHIQA